MPPRPHGHAPCHVPPGVLLATVLTLGWLAMAEAPAPAPDLRPGRYVVDALEPTGQVRLEALDGAGSVVVPRGWLPTRAREGDVVVTLATQPSSHDAVRFEVDAAATEQRRRALQGRRDGLPSAPSGDLDL